MSELKNSANPVFRAAKDDPSRAESLSVGETKRLCQELRPVLRPLLFAAGERLKTIGYTVDRVETRGTLASLMLQNSRLATEAWVRFQIHPTFAPLLSAERIFWMTAVHKDKNPARRPSFPPPV